MSPFVKNAIAHHLKTTGGKRLSVKKIMETPEPNDTADEPVQPNGQLQKSIDKDSVPGPISISVPSYHMSAFSAMAGKKRKRVC